MALNRTCLGPVWLVLALTSAAASTACEHKESTIVSAASATAEASSSVALPSAALPGQDNALMSQALAKVDDVVITVGEFQERINRQSPYIRARYTSLEQKREFLDNLIRFEVLAKEAKARNFDKDPDVVRTMKQVMIQKLMKDEFENKLDPQDIPESELMAYYKEHESDYNQPEKVRVTAIILSSQAKAKAVGKKALGDQGKTHKGFRELVEAHSIDEVTKKRGGDLLYFTADSTEIPKPVVKAAFALKKTGDLTGPINAGNGRWYILKQTGRRKAVSKSFKDVKRQIQNRLFREKRNEAQKAFLTKLRDKANVEINEENLGKIRIDTNPGGAPTSHDHGGGNPMKSQDSK